MSNFIQNLTQLEEEKQQKTLNLIASENYPSSKVLELLGSHWSNKYGEGYPGKRYYAGNEFTDKLESFAQEKALEVFRPKDKYFEIGEEYGVNVQVLSGSPANAMVFLSILEVGDTVLSLNLSNGGHLSHLHQTSNWLKFFKLANYDVKEVEKNCFEIDMEDFENKLKTHRPKLTIIGASSYPRLIFFRKMVEMAHNYGSLVLADIAHINGLVATGLHPSPFLAGESGADFVSMTTHKTFRGPRAAMLFYKKKFEKEINKTVFPGTSGGPHFNKIAAMTQACLEILDEDQHPDGICFADYSKKTLQNTKALENSLLENGLEIISPTQNHLCLVKLPEDKDSLETQKKLEKIGIICNRNVIPFDTKTAWKPSGLRLGMPALTSRGATLEISRKIGQIISDSIFDKKSEEVLIAEVKAVVGGLGWW
jgi:glycine hydroxymethyltransferase